MKVLKLGLLCLCIISFLLPLVLLGVSSIMQSYYKTQIDDLSKNEKEIKEIIAKKMFWASIGETTIIKYSYVVFAFFVLVLFVGLLLKVW